MSKQTNEKSLTRSEQMARIRARDTGPELALRRALHTAGLRFRLHARELPGRPDVVFRPARVAIFVHGCFWHQHPGCGRARVPRTRADYWLPKFARNTERDVENCESLQKAGWTVLTLWECESLAPILLARFVAEVCDRVRPPAANKSEHAEVPGVPIDRFGIDAANP